MKNIKYIIPVFILFFALQNLHAKEPAYGNFIIFTMPQNSIQLNAIARESERLILDTCTSLGRLLPIEKNRLPYALSEIHDDDETIDLAAIARALDASLYMVINLYSDGKTITAEAHCIALKAEYKQMEKIIIVQGAVPSNIPLKLASEMAALHNRMPIYANITRTEDGHYIIDAGQWHGLSEGDFSTDIGTLKIISSGRYYSTGRFQETVGAAKIRINTYPDTGKVRNDIDARISKNTLSFYDIGSRALKDDDPEKRFITGACLINPAANACMPVYGSFLAVDYLGFNETNLHKPGFAVALFSFTAQLTFTGFMTGFKTNFFPWVKDSDKSASVLRLQRFLWCSLPLTFTISYFDQLAWQMNRTQNLPPFFKYRDGTAAVLSFLVPGGGLMYKGLHVAGWSYYAAEMSLAGYAFYSLHSKKAPYIFGALGALKGLEMIHAFLAEPGYSFYKLEKNGRRILPVMYNEISENESIFNFGLAMNFNWDEGE
ncbi:MAG: hypothetical protein FWG92_02015 [Leptospirales bacterium]|nr:hypothetical protein [Leptospirales bacterium]